jgi:hypothetical protein
MPEFSRLRREARQSGNLMAATSYRAKKDEAPGGSFSIRTALPMILILRKFSNFSCSRYSLLSACRFTSSYLGD